MIRALLTQKDGKPLVLLGLEPVNLNRLREGQPIKVNLRQLDPDGPPTDLPDIDVAVFFAGGDELRMLEDLARC